MGDYSLTSFMETLASEEQVLVQALKRGEDRAFGELVHQHQHRVFGLCLRLLGDSGEAEDLAQEVFLSVFRAVSSFRGECRLSTWLYRITRNHCLNRLKFLKRRAREKTYSYEEVSTGIQTRRVPASTGEASLPRPDRQVEGLQLQAILETQLKSLSEEHREVIVLRDLENLSYEEIESITGLAEGTVKSRLHRARMELMRLMEPFLT